MFNDDENGGGDNDENGDCDMGFLLLFSFGDVRSSNVSTKEFIDILVKLLFVVFLFVLLLLSMDKLEMLFFRLLLRDVHDEGDDSSDDMD